MAVFEAAGAGDGAGNLRLQFSLSVLRRKLIEAISCGCSRQKLPAFSPRRLEASETETRRRIKDFEAFQLVVSKLAGGDDNVGENCRREAAVEVRRLAKDDGKARERLAALGAIPPLVSMIDSGDSGIVVDCLYALLNLGIGNDLNKAAIVEAGAVHKMLSLIESKNSPSTAVSDAIVANFLGLSALDLNKPIIGSATGAIEFLISVFKSGSTEARDDALRAIFNLTIEAANVARLVDIGAVADILAVVGDDTAVSERALAVLSNVVAVGEGRRAVSRAPDSIAVLVDVLSWSDAPNCQEKAVYILMIIAHKNLVDRTAMVEAGIASVLLELMLVGSALAQKRASRLLEIVNGDKGKGISYCSNTRAVSAPLCGTSALAETMGDLGEGMSVENRAVKELVQQSLQSNMRRIARRANLPQDFAPSERLKVLTTSSTSKSLPF